MITCRIASTAALALAVALAPATSRAAEITVLCSNGLKAVMEELAPRFEKASGHTVVVTYGLAAQLKTRIEAGEAFDLAVLTPPLLDDLIGQRRVAADTRAVIARTGLGLMVRAGGRKPDVSTTAAFTSVLTAARSIAYAREGASGVAFAALIQKLGIAGQLESKVQPTATGEEVGERVARGEAELGVLPLSEILPVRGAELLGLFPADVQSYIVMVAGVNAAAKQAGPAREFIAFMTAPAALPVITAKGMERN
jgi:molybdate transport system substrate-binding protein